MRLLVFSDLHGDLRALGRLLAIEADYYICAGDLVNWNKGLARVGPAFARRAAQTYVLPGNHETADGIAAFCREFGLHNLHQTAVELGGWHVAGLGYSSPTPFDTPGEFSESEIEQRLRPFAGLRPLILVCHAPPKNTPLDRAGTGKHFGSQAVADFVVRERPRYFFCGHIHEAEGVQHEWRVDGEVATVGVNAGKQGYLLEL